MKKTQKDRARAKIERFLDMDGWMHTKHIGGHNNNGNPLIYHRETKAILMDKISARKKQIRQLRKCLELLEKHSIKNNN